MPALEDFMIDDDKRLRDICRDFGLPYDEHKAAEAHAKMAARVESILTHGLDIGGLVRCVVPVGLVNHETHGWCFYAGSKRGYYPVYNHVRL